MSTSSSVPTITRGDIEWPKSSYRAKAKFLHDRREEQRTKLLGNMELHQIPQEQRFAEIERFDNSMPMNDGHFAEYMFSPQWQPELALLALQKLHGDKAEAMLDQCTEARLLPILAEVYGIPLAPISTKEGGDDSAANPTGNPSAYGT